MLSYMIIPDYLTVSEWRQVTFFHSFIVSFAMHYRATKAAGA